MLSRNELHINALREEKKACLLLLQLFRKLKITMSHILLSSIHITKIATAGISLNKNYNIALRHIYGYLYCSSDRDHLVALLSAMGVGRKGKALYLHVLLPLWI